MNDGFYFLIFLFVVFVVVVFLIFIFLVLNVIGEVMILVFFFSMLGMVCM